MLGQPGAVFSITKILMTPASLVVVVLDTVPPNNPEPLTVCILEPNRLMVPTAVVPMELLILPLLVKFPPIRSIFPVVP